LKEVLTKVKSYFGRKTVFEVFSDDFVATCFTHTPNIFIYFHRCPSSLSFWGGDGESSLKFFKENVV